MKQLLLIRHALPHEGHATNPIDPPLHEQGRLHAQRLAEALRREGIDRIVCSPQQRALDTAAPLVAALGLELEVVEGIAEVDRFAAIPYRSADTMRVQEPHRWPEFLESPARFLGRDPVAYRETVANALAGLVENPRGRRIAVFSHGMTIKTMLGIVLGMDAVRYGQFAIAHCSVSRLSGAALGAMRIDSVNESLCESPAGTH
jgi:broad specificity phosphatase PhoE